jgi:AcrR family transcriptional regulator
MARPIVKRDEIVRAALELFVERGIAGTTTRDIAQRAQAAEGTMYRYYRSKEELAWEVYFTHLERFMAELRAAVAGAAGTRERLRRMIAAFFALFDRDPVVYSYLVLAEHALAHRLPPGYESPPALLLRVLAEGQARGDLPPGEVHELGAVVMGTVARLATFRIYGRIGGPLGDRVERMAALCWRAIATPAGESPMEEAAR